MQKSQITLPREAIYILEKLQSAGFEAFIVGGAVRDLLRLDQQNDLKSKSAPQPLLSPYSFDYDFTTQAKPEEMLKLFVDSFYENDFGTVSITLENLWEQMAVSPAYRQAFATLIKSLAPPTLPKIIDLLQAKKMHISLKTNLETPKTNVPPETDQKLKIPNFEMTTYRSQELYENGPRKPSSLSWGESLSQDLGRRDFTINALAISISPEITKQLLANSQTKSALTASLQPDQYEIIDEHHSLADLEAMTIKTVGDANQRFAEDALRMLRAIRLAVQLDFQIDDLTLTAIQVNAKLLQQISWERIRDELLKMLSSPQPKRAIELLDETNLLKFILPELLTTKGIKQGGHHTTDVWTHALDTVQACPSSDPVVKLASLLHDIAKPQTYEEKSGQITAYNHEVLGSRMVKNVARRLKLSSHDQQRIFILTRFHMFHYQPKNTDASIRRLMRQVGLENIDDILDLREGDRLGSGARKTSWRLEEMKQRMIEQLNQPLAVTDLAINGRDLMQALNLQPGPKIGQILALLLEKVLDQPELNQKEKLLELAKESAL
ncbi:MAG: CCA tRNA nucleotidyltransferase [Patescibacteria group bacterium]